MKSLKRIICAALCMLLVCAVPSAGAGAGKKDPADRESLFHREPLLKGKFAMLPLGSVKPKGWLKRELEIMADGLTGHMDSFYHLLQDNGWLGQEGPPFHSYQWAPYYCDGLVPLAYLLEDDDLIATADKWIGWTLEHPHEDGWIGPPPEQCYRSWGMWYPTPMLKALVQHHQATGDERVLPVLRNFFKAYRKRMEPKHGRTLLENSDHQITLTYFESGGGEGLEVLWEGPDFEKQRIPDKALRDLEYEYYEGRWKSLPDFDSLQPVDSGKADNFDLGPIIKKNKKGEKPNNFAIRFKGRIAIRTNGWYTFYLVSDDGSRLYINGQEVVDNDGIHPMIRGGIKPAWAYNRWGDAAIVAIWLYDRTGDKSLLDLVKRMSEKGRNWSKDLTTFKGMKKPAGGWGHHQHGVNVAMGLKTPGICYLLTKDEYDYDAIFHGLANLDRYHGTPVGTFTAEECLAGLGPDKGTEFCDVLDEMFSLEVLLSVTGDVRLADRLEKITFNALPATVGPRQWTHQYFQRANQVVCREKGGGFEFGLDPNFPCCTANMPQGWPKFAANTWMATKDNGLAAVVYAPSEVRTAVGNGHVVTVTEETEYPFDDTITFTVKTRSPVEFPLYVRIPGWTKQPRVTTPDGKTIHPTPGKYFVINREWKNGDKVKVVLPMHIDLASHKNNTVSVRRGPLVYSLKIGQEWRKIRDWKAEFEGKTEQCADWEIYPATPWNYALEIDADDPESSFEFEKGEIKDYIFDYESAPVRLKAKGRRVPEWKMTSSDEAIPQRKLKKPLRAGLPPAKFTHTKPLEDLILIPYGAAKIRITVFPIISK